MSLTEDILGTYFRPRLGFEKQLGRNVSEESLLLYVMLSCLLAFVARLPDLVWSSAIENSSPLYGIIAAQFVVSALMAPLLLYGIAAISHLIASIFGGKASWRESRLALFWSTLAFAPLVLLSGLINITATDWFAGAFFLAIAILFLAYWLTCLFRVEFQVDRDQSIREQNP